MEEKSKEKPKRRAFLWPVIGLGTVVSFLFLLGIVFFDTNTPCGCEPPTPTTQPYEQGFTRTPSPAPEAEQGD